jgi:hypothetical protein
VTPTLPGAPTALADWGEPLPPEERDRLMDAVAAAVAQRGLQVPAVFALEVHKPLGFVASQTLLVFGPLFFAPLLGIERTQRLARLLAEPGAIEELIRRIEGMAA